MTYAIFDSAGNLVDAFTERGPALDRLAGIAQADPVAAKEICLVAQDAEGNIVDKTDCVSLLLANDEEPRPRSHNA